MGEKHSNIEWLDWLSSRGERRAKKEPQCIFAGMSRNIPNEIKDRLGITKYSASYCIIHESSALECVGTIEL